MADKTWKAVERQIARRLGGQRVGVTGRATADVIGSWFVAEVKHRKRLPQWLLAALDQARAAAGAGQLPICILHQAGERHTDDLVLLRMADFEALCGIMDIEHPF